MPKVLLVEDDSGLRQLVVGLLEAQNYTVDGLDTGDAAISWLKAYQYDLIILDWELPGASGVEVCREFRQRGGRTPILMLTGNAKIDHKEEAYTSGADDYLSKPFHHTELLLRVRALLKRVPELRSHTVEVCGLVLDEKSYSVRRGEEEISLSRREWQLLSFLMCRPDQFFPDRDYSQPRLGIGQRCNGRCLEDMYEAVAQKVGLSKWAVDHLIQSVPRLQD